MAHNEHDAHWALVPQERKEPRRVVIKRRKSFLGFTWFETKEIVVH